nr:nuclear transport factor 2 family protein [Pseudoalteromonas sp. Of7M-16]
MNDLNRDYCRQNVSERKQAVKKALLITILSIISCLAYAKGDLTRAQLVAKANGFVAAKNARQQPNSTRKDIEYFLSLLADEFVDEHVKYNFTYTSKAVLRDDMVAKLKDKVIHSHIEINNMMIGRNVVIIKMTESGQAKPAHLDKTIDYKTTNIVSLEFDSSGLITHIRRHHG